MNKTKKDIVFNLYMYFVFLCLSLIGLVVLIKLDIEIEYILPFVLASLTLCLYQKVLYIIYCRHEQSEEYFKKIIESMEQEEIQGLYDYCVNSYNRVCYEIAMYKNKIDKIALKNLKSKTIFRLLRYKHLMNKLDVCIIQKNLYKGYLNYWNIKRYGKEYPVFPKVEELKVKENDI